MFHVRPGENVLEAIVAGVPRIECSLWPVAARVRRASGLELQNRSEADRKTKRSRSANMLPQKMRRPAVK